MLLIRSQLEDFWVWQVDSWGFHEQKEKSQRVWTEETEVVEHSFIHLFIHLFVYFYIFAGLGADQGGWVPFSVKLNFSVVIFSSKLTYLRKEFLVSSNSLPLYIAEDRVPQLIRPSLANDQKEKIWHLLYLKSFTEYLIFLLNFP